MNVRNSKKRMLISSIISMALCIAMLIGSTFAWFTDSVKSGNNKIVAGNLDIELYNDDQKVDENTKLFDDVDLWEPGVVAYENLTIKNEGTLALNYKLALNFGDFNSVNENGKSLKDILKMAVVEDTQITTGDNATSREQAIALGDDATWNSIDTYVFSGNMDGTADSIKEKNLVVIIYWNPSDEDNDFNVKNGMTTTDNEPLFVDMGVALTATQKTSESDSFGNDYDKNAIPTIDLVTSKAVQTSPDGTVQDTVIEKDNFKMTVPSTAKAGNDDLTKDSKLKLEIKNVDSDPEYVTTAGTASVLTLDVSLVDQAGTKIKTEDGQRTIDIELKLDKELYDVTVLHDGIKMDESSYSYNFYTGVLTIHATSFSPYTVGYNNIAKIKINDTVYETLTDALNAAEDNDVIKISSGILDLKGQIYTINKNITIEGPYSGSPAKEDNRNGEAILKDVIFKTSNCSSVAFDGLKFLDDSKIQCDSVTSFTMKNCVTDIAPTQTNFTAFRPCFIGSGNQLLVKFTVEDNYFVNRGIVNGNRYSDGSIIFTWSTFAKDSTFSRNYVKTPYYAVKVMGNASNKTGTGICTFADNTVDSYFGFSLSNQMPNDTLFYNVINNHFTGCSENTVVILEMSDVYQNMHVNVSNCYCYDQLVTKSNIMVCDSNNWFMLNTRPDYLTNFTID